MGVPAWPRSNAFRTKYKTEAQMGSTRYSTKKWLRLAPPRLGKVDAETNARPVDLKLAGGFYIIGGEEPTMPSQRSIAPFAARAARRQKINRRAKVQFATNV